MSRRCVILTVRSGQPARFVDESTPAHYFADT